MCHNYDTSKGRSFGEGKSLYESSFEEGEISSRILHPGKVATEDNSATQMLWYISYDFPTVSKVVARLQKKTPT